MKNVESILTGFVANINDQNYIDKAVYFIANKDTFVDAVEKVEVCATFIKNKQTNAESWKNFVNIVNSNIKKANISDQLVRSHEKLLLGGIWAIIDMEYDPMITVGSKVSEEWNSGIQISLILIKKHRKKYLCHCRKKRVVH